MQKSHNLPLRDIVAWMVCPSGSARLRDAGKSAGDLLELVERKGRKTIYRTQGGSVLEVFATVNAVGEHFLKATRSPFARGGLGLSDEAGHIVNDGDSVGYEYGRIIPETKRESETVRRSARLCLDLAGLGYLRAELAGSGYIPTLLLEDDDD